MARGWMYHISVEPQPLCDLLPRARMREGVKQLAFFRLFVSLFVSPVKSFKSEYGQG